MMKGSVHTPALFTGTATDDLRDFPFLRQFTLQDPFYHPPSTINSNAFASLGKGVTAVNIYRGSTTMLSAVVPYLSSLVELRGFVQIEDINMLNRLPNTLRLLEVDVIKRGQAEQWLTAQKVNPQSTFAVVELRIAGKLSARLLASLPRCIKRLSFLADFRAHIHLADIYKCRSTSRTKKRAYNALRRLEVLELRAGSMVWLFEAATVASIAPMNVKLDWIRIK